jgi:hypothetical protein
LIFYIGDRYENRLAYATPDARRLPQAVYMVCDPTRCTICIPQKLGDDMKTYEVELERISYTTITVQAENEDAAEEAAWEELAKGDFKDEAANWRVESVEEVFS